ncbi:MAG: GNAT family N-acetyltransferase, partial [Synechococcaceae cyanobacterium]|nr:GNAT family N-acetyltransferase [Synechococcaceae cyanobacterium]
MAVRIDAFDPGQHDTKDFRCGSDSQDNVLRRTAKRQQRDGYTRLTVATDAAQTGEPQVCLGFYAINAHAIGVADVPSDAAPRPPRSNLIPGVFLSHLAVDERHQDKGLGRILLVDAMQQCQRAEQILGVRLIVLDVAGAAGDAERARLQRFYASMGFRPLPGRPERLFFSLNALPPLRPGGSGIRMDTIDGVSQGLDHWENRRQWSTSASSDQVKSAGKWPKLVVAQS